MPNHDGKNLIEGKNQGERIILYYRKYIVTFFLRDIDGLDRTESEKLKMSFGLMLLGLGVYFILHFSTPSVYTGGGWSEKSHLLAWLIFSRFTFSLPYIVSVMVQGRLRSESLASGGPKTQVCQNQNHPVTRPSQETVKPGVEALNVTRKMFQQESFPLWISHKRPVRDRFEKKEKELFLAK